MLPLLIPARQQYIQNLMFPNNNSSFQTETILGKIDLYIHLYIQNHSDVQQSAKSSHISRDIKKAPVANNSKSIH